MMPFGGEISAFDAAFPRFLLSTGSAGLMLLVAATIYILLTPWKELSLVRDGNTAAGIALGAAIAGLAIPISSTLASSMTLAGLFIWGAIALLMQLIAYRLVDLILRDIPGRIAKDEIGAATVLAAAKLSAAMIPCSWPLGPRAAKAIIQACVPSTCSFMPGPSGWRLP